MQQYPVVDCLPNQPDDRLKAYICGGGMPKNHQQAVVMALSLATSCLTLYADPEPPGTGNSYLPKDGGGKYARDVIDNITYLRLARFETPIEVSDAATLPEPPAAS